MFGLKTIRTNSEDNWTKEHNTNDQQLRHHHHHRSSLNGGEPADTVITADDSQKHPTILDKLPNCSHQGITDRSKPSLGQQAIPLRTSTSSPPRPLGFVTLNVGGEKHKISWACVGRIPHARLGKLARSTDRLQIQSLCDDFEISGNHVEFFFDRHPKFFETILNFYRTGKLHLTSEETCAISFAEDLEYWGIDDLYLESCCQHR